MNPTPPGGGPDGPLDENADGPFTVGDVGCADIRTLLSAAVDGEASVAEHSLIDAHLAGCESCRAHAERLSVLTRQVRLRPVERTPDLAARVMDRARPARLGRGGWLQPALAWVGLVIAVQSIGPLVLGQADGASTHVARHLGAFSLALAIGFVYAAWRPHRAFGLLPFAAALVVTMTMSATFDLVGGSSTVLAESVHLSELVGLVLLWMISGSPGWERVVSLPRRVVAGHSRS